MSIEIALTDDIATCRALRRTVFIEEQSVPVADEVDHLDPVALHVLATENGTPVGTARLIGQGTTLKIGRVCVLPSHRGTGLGADLIWFSLLEATTRGYATAKLGAQTHAIEFYQKLGFVAQGEIYDDAGIPHRDMYCAL